VRPISNHLRKITSIDAGLFVFGNASKSVEIEKVQKDMKLR
jgi:hypothetical protein